MIRILVAEDDEKLRKIISSLLNSAGSEVLLSGDGEEALSLFYDNKIDLIVSDIMMPKMDGFAFVKNVRLFNKEVPILFMTAREDMSAKEKGYALNVDDYIVKPFEMQELLLRIGALLRRAKINQNKKIALGDFIMDEEERVAKYKGEEISLSVREFNILFKLLSFPNKTFTRSNLMEEFWDFDSSATSRTVDVYMSKLREKTSGIVEFEISTVHGLGYKAVIK